MTRLIGVIAALAVLSVAGWWFGLYQPAREQQAALEVEITQLQSRQTQLGNQRQQLRDLQQRAPEIRSDLDRLSGRIINQ